jgi:hypothetical protein
MSAKSQTTQRSQEKLVSVALRIQAASQLRDRSNSAFEAVQKDVASLQREMSNSDNPAIPKREKVPKNIDADEDQISIQNLIRIQDIKDTAEDINRSICLFLSLVAVIVLLSMFVGGIVLWETKLKTGPTRRCIEVVIGDGVCDDRQNVAECNYDGQDCCLHTVNTSFCEDCRCHLGKCSKQSIRQSFLKSNI